MATTHNLSETPSSTTPNPVSNQMVVVEDDPTTQQMIQAMLGQKGYICHLHNSAESLLQSEQDLQCPLLLLDLRLPGMQGLELLQILQKEHPHIRTIVMTAHGDIRSAVEAMKRGAIEFFEKPLSLAVLLETLAHLPSEAPAVDPNRPAHPKLTPLAALAVQQGLIGEDIALEINKAHPDDRQFMRAAEAELDLAPQALAGCYAQCLGPTLEVIDLEQTPIDADAAGMIRSSEAFTYMMMPLAMNENTIKIVTSAARLTQALVFCEKTFKRADLVYVLSDPAKLKKAIQLHYP